MINWLEWIGVIPLLGLTGNWRGYRMGGKAIGGANMSTDMKKKFEAARASGNMDEAKAIADKTQKFNDDKKAEKAKAKEAKTIAPAAANNEKELSASDIKIKPVAPVKAGKSPSERQMAYSSDKLYVVIEPVGKNNYYVVYQHDGVAAKRVSTIGLGMEQRLKEEIAKRENKLKPRAASNSGKEAQEKAKKRLAEIDLETQTTWGVQSKRSAPMNISNPARFQKLMDERKSLLETLNRLPWQKSSNDVQRLENMPKARHRRYVEEALKEGKKVPQSVLDEYPDLNKAMAKTQPKAKPVAPRKRSNDANVRKEIKELQKKLDNTKTSLIGRGQNPDNNLSVTRLEIQLDELKRSLSN